jgi:hypothetical protein
MSSYNFTVRAKDESGAFSDREFSIQVKNNLIDRMVLINNENLYTSPDGVNFTTRLDKGGVFGGCWLDKWVVFTDNNKYRISSDTISWHENNSIVISDPTLGNNILYYIHTNNQNSHFIEHDGKLYVWVRTGHARPIMVMTEDLITWQLVKPVSFSVTNPFITPPSGINLLPWVNDDGVLQLSNTIVDGDSLLTFDSVNKAFIKYDILNNTSEYIIPTLNTQTFGTGNNGSLENAWFLQKVNGVYVVCFMNSGRQVLWYSSDLRSFNKSTTELVLTNTSNVSNSKRVSMYHNGTMYFIFRGIIIYSNFPFQHVTDIMLTSFARYLINISCNI